MKEFINNLNKLIKPVPERACPLVDGYFNVCENIVNKNKMKIFFGVHVSECHVELQRSIVNENEITAEDIEEAYKEILTAFISICVLGTDGHGATKFIGKYKGITPIS